MSKFNPIARHLKNPNSRTLAVNAKCAECVGCTRTHLEKGFKESISDCTSHSCHLYKFRPYQAKKTLNSQKIAVQVQPSNAVKGFSHE
jgi:hypothetical protein